MAPIIERIGSGCASNPMRVFIRLTAPLIVNFLFTLKVFDFIILTEKCQRKKEHGLW